MHRTVQDGYRTVMKCPPYKQHHLQPKERVRGSCILKTDIIIIVIFINYHYDYHIYCNTGVRCAWCIPLSGTR